MNIAKLIYTLLLFNFFWICINNTKCWPKINGAINFVYVLQKVISKCVVLKQAIKQVLNDWEVCSNLTIRGSLAYCSQLFSVILCRARRAPLLGLEGLAGAAEGFSLRRSYKKLPGNFSSSLKTVYSSHFQTR